jgi:hypothetical protein
MSEFKPGLYRHYKGMLYRALFLASHHETNHAYVVYVPLDYPNTGVRVREIGDWNATILVPNPAEQPPAFLQKPRFEWIGE